MSCMQETANGPERSGYPALEMTRARDISTLVINTPKESAAPDAGLCAAIGAPF